MITRNHYFFHHMVWMPRRSKNKYVLTHMYQNTVSIRNYAVSIKTVDESTDRTTVSQLLVFACGIDKIFCVTEELLGMFPMKGQTTDSELLSSLIRLCDVASLNMSNCVSITTDGAKSMIGTKIGMVTLLKECLAHCGVELLQLHCIVHQENLYGRELEDLQP
ncbi:hypothetical protein TNIN_291401 [Trichonephila inaurata madagascariensis]|uniref:Uncharacterized protein n=1 Tax=Trichonephila inaurata madagascariensis TaxID=2747483 RepID=A0A8X7BQ48_9ARAC|nr:hypothetical protein TNIN_291401 [Trichonephila inaurata madagascariensis]